MSDDGDYQDDYGGDDDYYDDGCGDDGNNEEEITQPTELMKKQSSVATHKNVEFVHKSIIITKIIESIDVVQSEQGISGGRALFLLRACGYNVQESQNIPTKIMDDIYFSETKESSEAKNKQKCLSCEKELDEKAFSLDCNHRYCRDCTDKYITEEFESQAQSKICCKCPFPSCKERFGYKDFEKLLQQQHYKEYLGLVENDAYALSNHIVKCPNKECSFVMMQLDQLSLKSVIKNIRCECKTLFCCACGSNAHEPLKCKIVVILKTLEKAHSQLKQLRDKQDYYDKKLNQDSSNVRQIGSFFRCPNECGRNLVQQDENFSKCPFCEGVFCRKCCQLQSSCKCVKEESKEDQQEKEVQEKEEQDNQEVKIPLPKVVAFLINLAEQSLECKQQVAYVKVAKKKADILIKEFLKQNKNLTTNDFSFIVSGLETLEDITLYLGHTKIFLDIGALSKADLIKFQYDDLQKLYQQLKPLLMEFHINYSKLSGNDVNKSPFQNFKEQVNRLISQVTKTQQNLNQDFNGVLVNEKEVDNNYNVYIKESPNALVLIKKEQEKRDQANKSFGGGMDFLGGAGRMGGGRMYGGYHKNQGPSRHRGGDSDDSDDDYMGQPKMTSQQKQKLELLNLQEQIKQKIPSLYEQCKKCQTPDEIWILIGKHQEKQKPVYESDDIIVILPKGIQINNRVYFINLEEENIQESKILQFLIKNHEQIFKLHEEKNKRIFQVSNWSGSFLNYFEFLIMQEYERIKKQAPKTSKFCALCKKSLYPENEPDYETKTMAQLKEVKDDDVIFLTGCSTQHASHISCFKQKIQQDGGFKCSCNAQFEKCLKCTISKEIKQINGYREYMKITYEFIKQTFEGLSIPDNTRLDAYLNVNDDTDSVYEGYAKAHARGLTFKVSQDDNGKLGLQFRIIHDTEKPGCKSFIQIQ